MKVTTNLSAIPFPSLIIKFVSLNEELKGDLACKHSQCKFLPEGGTSMGMYQLKKPIWFMLISWW